MSSIEYQHPPKWPNGKSAKKPTREQRDAQRKRESELFAELATGHGYTMREMPKVDDRVGFMFDGTRVASVRVIQLIVPIDSALARELDKLAKAQQDTKQRAKILGVDGKKPRKQKSSKATK